MGGAVRCHTLNERLVNVGVMQRSQSDQNHCTDTYLYPNLNKLILDPLTQRLEHIMSGGVEHMMEKWAEDDKKRQLQASNRLDTPYEVTYYLRVNGDKITHGHMKQVDDNLKIVYNTVKKSFTVFYI